MPLIVTRHPALIEFLAEEFNIVGDVLPHASPADVEGQHVYGVLPLHLAAHAALVTEVKLDLPPEARGRELSLDEVRAYFDGLVTYKVTVVE